MAAVKPSDAQEPEDDDDRDIPGFQVETLPSRIERSHAQGTLENETLAWRGQRSQDGKDDGRGVILEGVLGESTQI